jgi:cyclic-di-GMP-binding protein
MKISNILLTPNELKLEKLSFCENSVKSIQEWVNNLNLLHLGSTSKALFNAVIEISELKCPETLRFDLIQVIHPIIENTLNNIEKQYFNQSLISSERNDQIIELSLLLRTQFAKVYIEIAQLSHRFLTQKKMMWSYQKAKKGFQTARILASYYALQQLGLLLYQQQILYSAPRPGQWLITHQLMHYAMEHHYSLTKINHIQGTQYQLRNITQVYAQLILLDIFNNNQIRPSELQGLYLCTLNWASLIQITAKETTTSRYIVDTTKDLAPIYNSHQEKNFKANVFISTQNLLAYLSNNERFNKENLSENEKKFLSPALHFHIQNILTTNAERRHERYEYSTKIKICFGLNVAHYYLANGKDLAEILNQLNGSTAPNNKILNKDARKVYQVDVLDISVNGYRIKWMDETPKNLKTGEFILVQENTQSPWRGGVIRWIKQVNKTLEMGLEILAQDIAPCSVHLNNTSIPHYYSALLMQTTQLDESSTQLVIAGVNIFEEKQIISLHLKHHELQIYLVKPTLITQSFICYDFELLNEYQRPLLNTYIQTQLDDMKNQNL